MIELVEQLEGDDPNLKKIETIEKAVAAFLWFVTLFTIVKVACLYSRIKVAIGVLKATSDYIKDNMVMLAVPFGFFFVLFTFYTYWTISGVFMASCGDPVEFPLMPVETFKYDKTLQRFLIYHLLALFWVSATVNAALEFVVASSASIWYFSQGTGQKNKKALR